MTINKTLDGTTLTVAVAGRLDAVNARTLEAELTPALAGIKDLVLDFTDLDYIASGGIRVLASTYKIMKKQGSMVLSHVQPQVMDLFKMTALDKVFTFA